MTKNYVDTEFFCIQPLKICTCVIPKSPHVHIAVSTMDYGSITTTLPFGRCDTRICVDVPITDDEVLENPESFCVSLQGNGLDSRITLEPTEAEIEIIDNDGMYRYCSSLNHYSTLHTWPTICFNGCLPMQMP